MDFDLELILALEKRRCRALVELDMDRLSAMFTDDLTHIHSTGVCHGKAALLDYIAARKAFISIDRGELQMRLYGDVAVITGDMTSLMRKSDGTGDMILKGMVTQIVRRIGASWQFLAYQFTLDTPPHMQQPASP